MKTVITVIIVVCFLSLGEDAVVVALSSLLLLLTSELVLGTPFCLTWYTKNVNLK